MMDLSFIENDDNDNSNSNSNNNNNNNNNSNINSTNHTLHSEWMKAIPPIHFPKVCNVNTNYDLPLAAPFELITNTNREQYYESSSTNVFPPSSLC